MNSSRIGSFLYAKWFVFVAWYEQSVMGKLIKRLYGAISSSWTNSAFVRAFCAPDNCDSKAKKSLIYRIFYLPFAFLSLFANDWAVNICNWVKKTVLYKAVYCLVNNLIAVNTRFLGVFLLFGGGVYVIAAREFTNVLYIGALVAAAVLCLFDFSVLRALGYSIVKPLFRIFLSVEPKFDYYDEAQLTAKNRLLIAAVSGIAVGFLAAYVSPLVAVGLVGALVVLFNVPLGIGITVFAIPFLPTMLCAGLALLCFFAMFLKKCAAGDKEWKLDIVGFALILLMVIMLICSFTSVARENSLSICLLQFALMSFYFTIINTIKTKQQLYSLLSVFVISGLFVAAYGIIQYVFGLDMDKQVWVDEEMFTDIKMRAFSTLENPNVLGEYLLLVIPISIALMWSNKKFWTKFTYFGITAVLLLCMILTMSRGCWVGLLLAAAIFITFVDGRYWSLGLLALFLLPSILPASVLNRFLSIGNLGDTSSSYRLLIYLGTIQMLQDFWLVGIGPGSQAFNMIYPRYSYPQIDAPHAHNVFLQQTVETGIIGLAALLFVLIAFFRQMARSANVLAKKSMDRVMSIAIGAGVAAFFLQGVFDYVFYNYRVYMMFWMVLAFGMCLRYTAAQKKEAADD